MVTGATSLGIAAVAFGIAAVAMLAMGLFGLVA
jgi:hypothetical protein